MRNAIRGLQKWEKEAHEWSRYAGRLRMQAGSGLIGALESYYTQWKTKPTERITRDYMLWRLRLHLKWNGEPEFLEELNEAFDIGLRDTDPGPTYWDVKPEGVTGFTEGFNWRKDSGNAIRGGKVGKDESSEDMAE